MMVFSCDFVNNNIFHCNECVVIGYQINIQKKMINFIQFLCSN